MGPSEDLLVDHAGKLGLAALLLRRWVFCRNWKGGKAEEDAMRKSGSSNQSLWVRCVSFGRAIQTSALPSLSILLWRRGRNTRMVASPGRHFSKWSRPDCRASLVAPVLNVVPDTGESCCATIKQHSGRHFLGID